MQNVTHNGSNWWWILSDNGDEIELHLAENINFPTGYLQSQSKVEFSELVPFCAKDARVYVQVCDVLSAKKFDEASRFSLAISATFATQYLTPLATRSWYFKSVNTPSAMSVRHAQVNKLPPTSKIGVMSWVALEAIESANYLVLQTSGDTAYVMLVDEAHQITGSKTARQGDVFNVHKDRLTVLN